MITQVFTFGYGHVCPYTGQKLDDHYATVTAPDHAQCVALMVGMFGSQWAFQYDSPEAAGVERFGLVEHMRLMVGEPVAPLETSAVGS